MGLGEEAGQMEAFVKVMKALSDPNRVTILKMLLQNKMMCVCEIQAALRIAQPTVSKHLKILGDAGLVTCERDGLWMNYRPSDGGSSPYVASLIGNLRHWLRDDPKVAKIMEKLPAIRREDICNK
jgi:ArsR family transcriptional regulator